MKKHDYVLIFTSFLIVALVSLTGCADRKLASLQTQIHDIGNRIENIKTEDAAWKNVKEDCVIRQIVFSEDSFSFYLHCPNNAKPLKKVVFKEAYHLTQ